MKLQRVVNLTLLNFYITSIIAVPGNPCIKSGTTWGSDGQIAFLPQIESVSACIEICIKEENCNGYTWHGEFSTRLSNVCVLFNTLNNEHNCIDCFSGSLQR